MATKPTSLPTWATSTGSTIVGSLVATSAVFQNTVTQGGANYGQIKFTFSGSPSFASVIVGHKLTISGMAQTLNNFSNAYIYAVDDTADTIDVLLTSRTDATADETGATGAGTVTDAGAIIQEPTTAKKAQGFLTPQAPSDGGMNWFNNLVYQWLYFINDSAFEAFHKFTSAETWAASTGATLTRVAVDTSKMTGGQINIDIDGTTEKTIAYGETNAIVSLYDAASSVSIEAVYSVKDLDDSTYSGNSKSVAAQTTDPKSFCFGNGGLKMYITEPTNTISEYTLSTAYDITTASYIAQYNAGGSAVTGIEISEDGTVVFWTQTSAAKIESLSLSVPFDITSASAGSNSGTYTGGIQTAFITKSAGTKYFIVASATSQVTRYDMSTGWDPTTLNTTAHSTLSVSSEVTTEDGIYVSDDGFKVFVLDSSDGEIHQYNLTTAFDLSTGSYSGLFFNVSSQDSSEEDIKFNSDLSTFWALGNVNDTIYEYNKSSAVAGTAVVSVAVEN
jgi:hypothetical protein